MIRANLSLDGSSAPSYDPVAFGKMRADTVNAQEGNLTGYNCEKCRNRGYIAIPREDGSIVCQDCGCRRIRKSVWEMEKSGLKNIIQDRTFEKFQAAELWQKRLKEGAQEFARDLPGWLLLCGQSGSGKTHLATAVCRQRLLQGDEVRYMPWRDKIAELKSMSLDSPRRQELIQGYKEAQILYIDDLYKTGRSADGSAIPTQADLNLAFELINHRYINRLVTIVSTERSPQELVSLDEATGSRIIEMAGDHVYAIAPDMKKNYRLRKIVAL